MPFNPDDPEASPFDQQSDPNRMLSLVAAERLARLKKGYPVYSGDPGTSRFTKPPEAVGGSVMELLSRFLRPGQQTTPNTPRRNIEGIEEDIK